MQNKLLLALSAAALLTCSARAQDNSIATPTTPAPAVQAAQVPQQPQPAQSVTQAAPTPNQVIYAPRLPSPNELTSAASAQGLTVEQINQTSNQVTVIYRNGSGQTNTVAYQLLPTAGAAPTTVVAPTAPPTVIYRTVPTTVYYDTYDPYWPRYYYPPVSLSLGFGFYHGWGGFHGGYRGGWHGGGHHWR
jgi:hypothetical protein